MLKQGKWKVAVVDDIIELRNNDESVEGSDGMSKVINTPNDAFFKAAFSDKHVANDFLSTYLPKEVLEHVDLGTLELQKDSQVDEELQEQYSDLLYKVDIDGKESYFYFLIEHKSYNDKLSVLQLLRYMVGIWEDKIVKEKKNSLPMIMPMLVYHDKGAWKAHMKISDWIEGYDELPESMKRYVPDYEYQLHDIGVYANEKLVKDARTRLVIDILDKARYGTKEEIKELLSEAIRLMMKLRLAGESEMIIKALINYLIWKREDITPEEMSRIAGSISVEGSELVMTLAEQLIQKGEQIGLQEGELKKAKEMAKNLLVMGDPIAKIVMVTGLSEEEVLTIKKEIK